MNRTETFEKLRDILKGVYPSNADLFDKATEKSVLTSDLGLNSIGMLCLVISIEEAFGIDFGDVSFGDFVTVSDVLDFICK